jgi:hypothetical protein
MRTEGGRRVKLEKKPMVARREQLTSRKETEIVTKPRRSDFFVDSETNINNIVRKIRTALGDNPITSQRRAL